MTRSIGTSCVSSSDQAASSLSRALYLADLAPRRYKGSLPMPDLNNWKIWTFLEYDNDVLSIDS